MEFAVDFVNRSIYVERLGCVPAGAVRVKSDQIPKRTRVPTAIGLFRMQLAVQFVCDQVVLVPELNDPAIRNASHDRASWSAPVREKNGFPYDQYDQLIGLLLSQYFLGCGGPPRTTWSGRGEQEHHSDVCGGAVELAYEKFVVR